MRKPLPPFPNLETIDFASIEHACHELDLARLKLRNLRLQALLGAGWTVELRRSSLGSKYDREVFVPPGAKKIIERPDPEFDRWRKRREGPFVDWEPSYYSLSYAFQAVQSQAKRRCGVTSCDRRPRRKEAK